MDAEEREDGTWVFLPDRSRPLITGFVPRTMEYELSVSIFWRGLLSPAVSWTFLHDLDRLNIETVAFDWWTAQPSLPETFLANPITGVADRLMRKFEEFSGKPATLSIRGNFRDSIEAAYAWGTVGSNESEILFDSEVGIRIRADLLGAETAINLILNGGRGAVPQLDGYTMINGLKSVADSRRLPLRRVAGPGWGQL